MVHMKIIISANMFNSYNINNRNNNNTYESIMLLLLFHIEFLSLLFAYKIFSATIINILFYFYFILLLYGNGKKAHLVNHTIFHSVAFIHLYIYTACRKKLFDENVWSSNCLCLCASSMMWIPYATCGIINSLDEIWVVFSESVFFFSLLNEEEKRFKAKKNREREKKFIVKEQTGKDSLHHIRVYE